MLTQDILGIHQKARSSGYENIYILTVCVFLFLVWLFIFITLLIWVSVTPYVMISAMERMLTSFVRGSCGGRGQEVLNWHCCWQRGLENSNFSDLLLSQTSSYLEKQAFTQTRA